MVKQQQFKEFKVIFGGTIGEIFSQFQSYLISFIERKERVAWSIEDKGGLPDKGYYYVFTIFDIIIKGDEE